MKNIIFATIFLLASFSLSATVLLDPNKIIIADSIWKEDSGQYKNEPYKDILYDGMLIFRILVRFTPVFHSILLEAKNRNANVVYRNRDVEPFWTSTEAIEKHLSVSPNSKFIFIKHPNDILLSEGYLSYSISFTNPPQSHLISHTTFKQMPLLIAAAKDNKKFIQIDLNELIEAQSPTDFGNACSLVAAPISGDYVCAICLTNPKDTIFLPCFHLCACEQCAVNIEKLCPVCNKAFKSKERVYM